MKKFVLQLVILVIVIFSALFFATRTSNLPFFPQATQVSKLQIGSTLIDVEIADNAAKRKQGLGGRQSLATSSGMLFIFDKADKYTFWMKGLKFPLDLIWIKNKIVVDIIKNVQPPALDQKDETLPIYASSQAVDMVLEVNAGFTDSHNIQINDKIEIIN